MKRKIHLFLAAICVFSSLTACNSNSLPPENNTGSSVTESVVTIETEPQTELETDVWVQVPRVIYTSAPLGAIDESIEVNSNVADMQVDVTNSKNVDLKKNDRTIEIDGKVKQLTYVGSTDFQQANVSERIQTNYGKDEYDDELGNPCWFYPGTDRLHTYSNNYLRNNRQSDTDPIKSQEEIDAIAESFFKTHAGFDVSNAPNYVERIQDRGDYVYYDYDYRFCGYETSVSYYLSVTKQGKILTYTSRDAFLFEDFEGIITAEDIDRAAKALVFPSDLGGGSEERSLTVGSDGYLYLCLQYIVDGYQEVDDQGNLIENHPSRCYSYYVRVIPEA